MLVASIVGVITLACGPRWFEDLIGKATSPNWKHSGGPGPNVLLISIDMLRADHVHSYGYSRPTTPNLDRLASEGVLFENAISSSSWTLPAHASLFTSLPGTVHGCTDADRRLSDGFSTLAERFRAAGYATAGFFSGPFLHPAFGFGQGFDHYENCTSYRQELDRQSVEKWARNEETMRESHEDITNPTVLAAVRSWFTGRPEKPFFMFVHWWDAHYDFIPPPPYDRMFDPNYTGNVTGRDFFHNANLRAGMDKRDLDHLLALYDGEIAWTDFHIGQLLDDLRTAGLLDQTLVIVTSDHGTEFFEHGKRGHRMTLFDEVLRVPLLVRYPEVFPEGKRRAAQVRMVDVGPTILDVAGLPPFEFTRGRSLVSLARTGVAPPDAEVAYSDLFSVGRHYRALRTNDWKLIQDLDSRAFYYFDLRRDPGEHSPETETRSAGFIAAVNKYQLTMGSLQQLAVQAERLKAAAARAAGRRGGDDAMPDAVRRQLAGLGYIDSEEEGESVAGPGTEIESTPKEKPPEKTPFRWPAGEIPTEGP